MCSPWGGVQSLRTALSANIKSAEKNIFNPFKGKSAKEIDKMFKREGFKMRGPDPINGKGGYVNTRNQRSYHIDVGNRFGETSHVDVNRPRGYIDLLKKKFSME